MITTSTTPVAAGVLTTWNLSGVNDGTYTLHLVAQSVTGENYEDRLTVVLDGLVITDPSPFTVSITRGDGPITIRGTVAAANFARYGIGILAVNSNTWISNSMINLANGGLQPVHDGVLGTWDTTGAAPDTYQIYVTQIFTNNSSVYKSVKIVVDSTLHEGWPVDHWDLTQRHRQLRVDKPSWCFRRRWQRNEGTADRLQQQGQYSRSHRRSASRLAPNYRSSEQRCAHSNQSGCCRSGR